MAGIFPMLVLLLLQAVSSIATTDISAYIRLVDGLPGRSGRLEILYDGEWGTVCDDGFDINNATLICHLLGYLDGGIPYCCATFGPGTGPIISNQIDCPPGTTDYNECSINEVERNDCSHSNDVGVSCGPRIDPEPIRLVDGVSGRSGRLEIFHDNQWGTVCDDNLGTNEASAVCRQLGYPDGGVAACCATFGEGNGTIWAADIDCPPGASSLSQCVFPGWGTHSCSHKEDAGVSCIQNVTEGSVRLADGEPGRSGRLEIYHDDQWGTVCDNGFGLSEAKVTCLQLGFQEGRHVSCCAQFFPFPGSDPIWLDNVDCPPEATDLNQCSHSGWGNHTCSHYNDVVVTCGPLIPEGPIRLADGVPGRTGRLEIYHNNQWGTICDDGFSRDEANTVCRQLGFPEGGAAYREPHFGPGSGPIWADDVNCLPGATNLTECSFRGWGVHNCWHSEDVGVLCDPQLLEGPIRLVDGVPGRSGRLEIFHDSEWGTVCEHLFGDFEANVVCRHLGFAGAAIPRYNAAFGEGNGTIWADGIVCPDGASDFSNCLFPGWGVYNCTHEDDVGVSCDVLEGSIRLQDGITGFSGRLEIFHDGQWGTVCSDGFYEAEASTVCRQLGLPEGGVAYHSAFFGPGSGPIWADNVNCPTGATNLTECSFRGWGVHNCNHDEDVGVRCLDSATVATGPVTATSTTTTDINPMGTTTMDTTIMDTTTAFPDTLMCGSGICGHICNSTNAGYTCSCYDGYILEMNNATCRGPCPAGTSVTGDTCFPCPHGQYQQYREKPQCGSCPEGHNTSDTGSTSPTQCRTLCDLVFGECENGGRCVDDGGRPSCDCGETGFTGQTCVTDIDECLPKPCRHGGQCTNTPGGYECQCQKEAGTTYAGATCSNVVNREPEALDVTPLFGPVAGGTNITVLGNNFDAGFQPIRLRLQGDKYACPVWQSNGTYLVATTPRGEDLDVGVPLSIEVVFEGGLTISTRKSFEYRANPEITSLYPNNTLLEGGSTLTVDGQGLMSVDTPYLEITMEINTTIHETFNVIIETIRKYFRERCFVLTNERAECLTPAVVIPDSFNASDEHSTLALYAGFILDGYEKYRNLQNTSLESSRTLGYVPVHNMTPRTEVFVYNGQPLILRGARIDPDAEYSVLIGQGDCLITEKTSTSIHCDVPQEAPQRLPFSMSKYHTITLNILRSVNYTMGEVQYPPDEGLLIGLLVAAVVIVTLAIVVTVAIVATRKKKAAQRKTVKPMEEWIVLPALPSGIADSASRDDPVPMQIDYISLQRERAGGLRLQRHLQAMQQDLSWKATS